ncbi:MAG: dTDP-4-dehydrorhamnose reductase [FCB group bacterium]|nr:dTDP-4-dehydrorhamnose reductase [FCB group bacterium]
MQTVTVLLTGAAGQLGQILLKKLYRKYEVIPVDIVRPGVQDGRLKIHLLDITEPRQVQKVFSKYSPAIVINTAAMTHVDGCELDPDTAYRVNSKAVENLLDCCDESCLFVQISTDYVFDGKAGPYSESDTPCPNSVYGKSKLESENLLREKHSYSLIIRPNVLYNASPRSSASFFAWIYTSLKNNVSINVVTDQVSNPTYAPDLTELIEYALDRELTGLYHYGSRNYVSRYEFALEIADVFALPASLINPIKTAELGQAAARPAHSGLKTDKIEAAGGRVHSTGECLHKILAEWST